MTDSRYWGAPMTDSALRNEYREGRYRETIIGGGSIGKTSPDDGFPILTPRCEFKPSLRYDYPLIPRHSASRPIMDRELIMVFSSTNQGQ